MKPGFLRSFQVENFKAIRDSGRLEFGWLTAIIGNNGSGKSSLIEALETFRDITIDGLDFAMRRWRGFEQILNKAPQRKLLERRDHRPALSQPMKFRFDWKRGQQRITGQQSITLAGTSADSVFIQREQVFQKGPQRTERWTRNDRGQIFFQGERPPERGIDTVRVGKLDDGESLLRKFTWQTLDQWRFLMLNPDRMGHPSLQEKSSSGIQLAKDGSNIAEYLNEIKELDLIAFNGLVETIQFVLPYAKDLQPLLTKQLGREFYIRLREQEFEVPGWLVSTGTLRIVALLACLRHPRPPALLVIEEIENGLDPRTLNLLVEEIRGAIKSRSTQIILTTHSPYLLDLLDLTHLVIVEREEGQPVFRRPDREQLSVWSKSFSPGKLYTMGSLRGGNE